MDKQVVGAATKVIITGIGAVAVHPVLAYPTVFEMLTRSAEALALIGTATGAVLAVGYAHHRLQLWAALRPVMPAASQVYATLGHLSPQLQQTAAIVQAEARQETDEEHKVYHAVVTFCIIGESRRTFSFRDMRGCVDRPTWDFLTRYLAQHGVLTIGQGQRATWFADGWTSPRVRVALKRGELPLPDRTGNDRIIVKWNDYRRTMHTH